MSLNNFINPRDVWFWLYEFGDVQQLTEHEQFADFDREQVEAMFDAASRLTEAEFMNLAQLLDENEPEFDGENVINPPELKPALDKYSESGLHQAPLPTEFGGLGMPRTLATAAALPMQLVAGAPLGYHFLATAAANMMMVTASDEQKKKYLPNMVAGKWFGTMMLSEPQAGSSLADIRTRAIPQSDGSYHLKGSKMWISGGDHDLADNIIHLVLAKIEQPDGSLLPGTAGISLFIVPKFHVNEDGSLGERNGVRLSGINHKMGNRGIVNTVPVLGEREACVGELVGEAGKGLAGMFHMMNDARVAVGLFAAQSAYAGYRFAVQYALERPQGRAPTQRDLSTPQLPIIKHTDVRRMLLASKAYAEGAMALCFFASELIDRQKIVEEQQAAEDLDLLLGILTPIVKTWPSIWGMQANSHAIQVLGGYGYTREYPVERLFRDNRLNEIHEGTSGIQSLDLLGRKIAMKKGAALHVLLREISLTIRDAIRIEGLTEYGSDLNHAMTRVARTTEVLGQEAQQGRIENYLANSAVYLDMLGHVVVAWMWLRMGIAASAGLKAADSESDEADYYRGKLRACRYFYRWELPKTIAQSELLKSLDDTCQAAKPNEF